MRAAPAQTPSTSTNGRPHLTADQSELLRNALSLKASDDCFAPDSRPVIREIVNTCERADNPEQLLVAFKNSLDDVANAARIPFGPDRSSRLSALVSAFIEEIYGRAPIIRDGACRGK